MLENRKKKWNNMHERMKPITELVRKSTCLQLKTKTAILNDDNIRDAIEYLRDDEEIGISIRRDGEEDCIIEIFMKEE